MVRPSKAQDSPCLFINFIAVAAADIWDSAAADHPKHVYCRVLLFRFFISNIVICHFLFQGGMNISKQILQLSQCRDKLVPKLEKILGRVQSADDLAKIPPHIRQQMDSKVGSKQHDIIQKCYIVTLCSSVLIKF